MAVSVGPVWCMAVQAWQWRWWRCGEGGRLCLSEAAAIVLCTGMGETAVLCLNPGVAGMTVNTRRAEKIKLSTPPLLLISPPFFWTLEANIPPSVLALIITKDRMHKTWRTLKQRRPWSPFPPYAEAAEQYSGPSGLRLWRHTRHLSFFFCPPSFLCRALPLPLCYCAPWSDNCPRIVYLCLWNLHCAARM